MHVPFLQELFGTIALDPAHWLVAAAVALLALVAGETDKHFRRHRARKAGSPRLQSALRSRTGAIDHTEESG